MVLIYSKKFAIKESVHHYSAQMSCWEQPLDEPYKSLFEAFNDSY